MCLHTSIYTPSLQVHNTSESNSDSTHTALAPPPMVPQDSSSTPQFSPPSVPSALLPGSPTMSEAFDTHLAHLEQASQSQTSHAKVSPPGIFDGQRANGRVWWTSAIIYASTVHFEDDIAKIMWVLSYFQTGHAATYCQSLIDHGHLYGSSRFDTWREFKTEFIKEFMPEDEHTQASLTLEGVSYFQGTASVDEYVDEFRALITMAGLNVEPILYSTNPTKPTIKA
ncbi:hypothetical protein D9758_014040 [Tetrapyrgos nigripes]|uniref:Retrotransposon gag domain-containing protein n=1 Tax=Tetrapyrgos nigripes TaxID=182062 RepID=A0A8H5CXS2_9AGAR|nr:hypothetical protein D9758_014040 [Tetrapyrgos nigripes]